MSGRAMRVAATALAALAAASACAEAPRLAPAPLPRVAAMAESVAAPDEARLGPPAPSRTDGPETVATAAPSHEIAAPPGAVVAALGDVAAEAVAEAAHAALEAARAAHEARVLPAAVARSTLTGSVGYAVIDVATGETLALHNADRGFAPASVAKVPTALYALEALGPDGRFETRVLASGALRDGRLDGDLTLAGGGDPELDADDLAALARRAREAVGSVSGAFLVDAGVAAAAIDDTVPEEAAYNPSVARLNLNFNRVKLAWEREGGRLSHSLEAHAELWSPTVTTVAVAIEPDDCRCPTFRHDVGPDREVWRVKRAALSGEGSVWLPVRRPEAYAAEVFRIAAGAVGLALPQARPGSSGGRIVAVHASRPAIEIAADMLEFSTNLTAEALGLAGSAARGLPSDDLAASARAMSHWSAGYGGFPAGDFDLRNHSGLTPESRTTPRAMAMLLRAAALNPPLGVDLAALLEARPLDEADARAPAGAIVLAKTGTLDFVRGLAGYAVTPSGRRLAFAFFANDLDRRAATRGGEGRPEGALAWRNRAQRLERDLLRDWIARFDE